MPAQHSIRPLHDPSLLAELAADAEADGHRMVTRLIAERIDGTNRFNRPGEKLYAARVGDRILGVCGLNVDPFAEDSTIGRVRRLYVAVAHRRQGIATTLLHQLIADATPHFQTLHLRTHDPAAAAFYQSLGFTAVQDDPHCTHRRLLGAR